MSQDQSLSTEDLAGRRAPAQSESAPPPGAVPDKGDRDVTDHHFSDHDVSDPGVTLSDQADRDSGVRDSAVRDSGVSEQGAGDYGDTPSTTTGHGATSARTSDDEAREAGAADDGQRRPDDEDISLVDDAQAEEFRARWADVQVRFVDDPKEAVGAADALVAEAMQSLASAFADHKSRLETQWHGGGDVDTEELRIALRRYRVFFHRLLET